MDLVLAFLVRLFRRLALPCLLAPLLAACVSQPHHSSYREERVGASCPSTLRPMSGVGKGNADGGYFLHVLEFDDQGWAFVEKRGDDERPPLPAHRIDCAIDHLRNTVEREKRPALSFVYVHGWHHTADDHDEDLEKFEKMLHEQYRLHGHERRVIGFYIGWNGESMDFPLLRQTTFWGRKNAAHHVAEGSVREFFARLKALREYWNRPKRAKSIGIHECRRNPAKGQAQDQQVPEGARLHGPECPIRTVMMGHSFGALVLFASTSPYILETLANASDIPRAYDDDDDDGRGKQTERERGIADLVVLVNPAFEASRYDAVFNAARRYTNDHYELPLLVTITSDNDDATGVAFPVARTVNSAFQYPATTDLESRAMKRTNGYMTEYLTHELRFDGDWTDAPELYDPCRSAAEPKALRDEFVGLVKESYPAPGTRPLRRRFCGGLTLDWNGGPMSTSDAIVWNIRTHKSVIDGHNGIHKRPFEYFLEQLYEDLSEIPRFDWKQIKAGPQALRPVP